MIKQPHDSNSLQDSQPKAWTNAELKRVARVFELLINIDKRQKNKRGNEDEDKRNTNRTD
jgi:hypothetical protein